MCKLPRVFHYSSMTQTNISPWAVSHASNLFQGEQNKAMAAPIVSGVFEGQRQKGECSWSGRTLVWGMMGEFHQSPSDDICKIVAP